MNTMPDHAMRRFMKTIVENAVRFLGETVDEATEKGYPAAGPGSRPPPGTIGRAR